jgi:hypothetical protein
MDDRLTFMNLNMDNPNLNQLTQEEYNLIWKPIIRFLNKEPNSKV